MVPLIIFLLITFNAGSLLALHLSQGVDHKNDLGVEEKIKNGFIFPAGKTCEKNQSFTKKEKDVPQKSARSPASDD